MTPARVGFGLSLAVVATATAFATVGLAGSADRRPGGDPVPFLRGVVRQIAANDYETAWQTLAPGQQRLVPEVAYVRCESMSPIPGHLVSITLVRTFEQPLVVAGTGAATHPGRAVTFRITISDPALRQSVTLTHTVHALRVGRRWAWILPARRLEQDSSPTCGASASRSRS